MQEQIFRLIQDFGALRRMLVGDRIPPEAQAHFRAARNEALLGVRAVTDQALAKLEAEERQAAGPQSIPVEP
ncbi:MAG TPA: hypothetical protein VGK74_05895 [Symbiobacteriaceae bacterium]|jgi:hypothetical protein